MITHRRVGDRASRCVTLARASNPKTLNGYSSLSLQQNRAMEQGLAYGSAKESLRSIEAPYGFEAYICMTSTSLASRCSFPELAWPLRSNLMLCTHAGAKRTRMELVANKEVILCVDDEETSLSLRKPVLEKAGYEVI